MNNLYQYILQNSESTPEQLALTIQKVRNQGNKNQGVRFVEKKINESDPLVFSKSATYKTFVQDVDNYADYLAKWVKAKQKVILALPISYELYVCVFALFKLGACAVLLNPNVNRHTLKKNLQLVKATSIISNQKILKYQFLFWDIFKITQKISIDRPGLFSRFFNQYLFNMKPNNSKASLTKVDDDQIALISFTSGSSGTPKAVARTYQNLASQHLALKSLPVIENHYDITAFPVVALHHLCNGIHCEVADIDYKNVGDVADKNIVKQIQNCKVNSLSGAITYLLALGKNLKQTQINTDHIQAIATGGSPIGDSQIQSLKQYFSKARVIILYGSSEAEPIAHIEVDKSFSQQGGYLVGKVCDEVNIAFEALEKSLASTASISNFENLSGEIYVTGKHVCAQYYQNEQANQKFKFKDNNQIWHRTGDIGFINEQKQLVLTGRIENIIQTKNRLMGSYPIEMFINQTLSIEKSAVVQDNNAKVVVFLEDQKQAQDLNDLIEAIKKRFSIEVVEIKFIEKIPVDARHQGKIQYAQLK